MSNRSVARLSAGMENRLYAYTAAGAAALTVALGPCATAGVVHTETKVSCGFNAHVEIDLNHDGTTDFTLLDAGGDGGSYFEIDFGVVASNGNQFAVSTQYALPVALNLGDTIGPNLQFNSGFGTLVSFFSFSSMWGAAKPSTFTIEFLNATNKFVGLKFLTGGQTHYGWARIDTKFTSGNLPETPGKFGCALIDYAYETVPNTPIVAGQGIKPNYQPETLGWMAVGSNGLSVLRNQTNK